MTHTLIYPHTARHNNVGHLEIGGCDVVELADTFGTPLFIYDEQTLRDQCEAYRDAFRSRVDDAEIVYASKAFCCRAMCELVAEEGLSIDVASGGELHTARLAGVPPERVYFHGNNKSPAEIEAGLDYGIGFFVVDSLHEIAALDEAARRRGLRQRVLVRLTPGVRPTTHSYVQTGQADSKFGFGLDEGLADEAVRAILAADALDLVGVHAHIGSQIFDLSSHRREVEILFGAVADWHRDHAFDCRLFNFGGGLGIRYTEQDQPSSIAEFADAVVGAARASSERYGLPLPRLLVEPGRSIAGKAAVTAYRIGTIKEIPGVRTYVAIDGGMSDNMRPMLYDSKYEAMLANKAEVPATHVVSVAGKHCEMSDVLVRDVAIAPPEVGDVLVTPGTGAYGYVMANNYNMQPRPAIVIVRAGAARLIVARETWDDVARLHRPLHASATQ